MKDVVVYPKGSPRIEAEGKHIYFWKEKPNPKTKIWSVYSKSDNTFLGEIRWFSRWRQYCFYPEEKTVDAPSCLVDIANFLKEQTTRHKELLEVSE